MAKKFGMLVGNAAVLYCFSSENDRDAARRAVESVTRDTYVKYLTGYTIGDQYEAPEWLADMVACSGREPAQRVRMIKAVRSYAKCGLKEAKDFCDEVWDDNPVATPTQNYADTLGKIINTAPRY